MRVILASGSPRRKKLLARLNIDFEVVPAEIEETFEASLPGEIVQELARKKAEAVASASRDALIIGADTIVVLKNKILGKPANNDEARAMLEALSGQTHQVFTGIALILKKDGRGVQKRTFAEETKVTFGSLTQEEINAYTATGSPLDKAGAYGIQDDPGSLFVKSINGDYNTVVGLPLFRLYNELKTFLPELLTISKVIS